MTTKTKESVRLYHKDIYMPEAVKAWENKNITIGQISRHAQQKAEERGIDIPENFFFSGKDIIEMETFIDGSIKFVIRIDYSYNDDLCLVICFYDNWNHLVTVYLNDKFDDHKTLDESRYYSPFAL